MFILRELPLEKSTKNIETGIIHNARASFTVVATCKASLPYTFAAPITELVS